MLIPTTETRMPGRRRVQGSSAGLSPVSPPARAPASRRDPSPAKRISSAEAGTPGHGPSKRSSSTSSPEGTDDASYPTWVMLNRVGVRRDSFVGDRTTSAVSCTSGGEQVSVSFELVKPPRTSLLTLDWPQGPSPSQGSNSYPHIIAAHGNVVLLEIIYGAKYPRPAGIDHFIYKAGRDPSLMRLPIRYWKGPSNVDSPRPRIMNREATGILSCSKDSFIVAELEKSQLQPSAADIHFICSGSDEWKVFKNLNIRRANGIAHLCWWATDVVLTYKDCYIIWIDYLRGIIVADMTHPEPVLRYVSLPVDPVQENPYHSDYGRGNPEATRSLCNTRRGIKFVSIEQCGAGFSITLWSLCENQTWREDATLDADEFWGLDSENCLPRVLPEFPVVDMDNPDAVCFLLDKGRHTSHPGGSTWMIKVHMKNKILMDFTEYSYKASSSSQDTSMAARIMSKGCSFISTELPCYVPKQSVKMRRRMIT
ncbi:unnamed protein product [Urochloa humidicola]